MSNESNQGNDFYHQLKHVNEFYKDQKTLTLRLHKMLKNMNNIRHKVKAYTKKLMFCTSK